MRLPFFGDARLPFLMVLCTFFLLGAARVLADQVEMSNGDRYVGQVLSLTSSNLVLQNEFLGTLRLPRSGISSIALEPRQAGARTNLTRMAPALRSSGAKPGPAANATNSASGFSAAMRQLGANSNAIQQVQEQLLTGAGPEAQAKFNDLLGGLLSGKVDLNGLRAEAKSTLEQAKRVRGDLGEEGGGMLDSYLAILDNFLKETESETTATNSSAVVPKLKAPKTLEEE